MKKLKKWGKPAQHGRETTVDKIEPNMIVPETVRLEEPFIFIPRSPSPPYLRQYRYQHLADLFHPPPLFVDFLQAT
ncbi:hypothetical protein RYH73_07360 [Olivibacter sp. CPCC 100613]